MELLLRRRRSFGRGEGSKSITPKHCRAAGCRERTSDLYVLDRGVVARLCPDHASDEVELKPIRKPPGDLLRKGAIKAPPL